MKYYLMTKEDAAAYEPLLQQGPWGTVFTELGLQWEHAFIYEGKDRENSVRAYYVRCWDAFVLVDYFGEYGSLVKYAGRVQSQFHRKVLAVYGLPEIGKYNMNAIGLSMHPVYAADDEIYHLLQCSGCQMIELVKLVRPKRSEGIKKASFEMHWPGALYRNRPMHVPHPPSCRGGVPSFTDALCAAFQKAMDNHYQGILDMV